MTSDAAGLVGADTAPTTVAPGTIPSVSVRSTSDAMIYVSWAKPTSGQTPTAYDVLISPNLGLDLSDCINLSAERTSCVISDAGLGRSYKVSVAAIAGAGKGVALETESFQVPEKVRWQRYFTDTKWRTLLVPRSYGIWPLLVGTLMIAVLAMLVAVPIGLLSAIFLSEYAHPRLRAITKPILEVLAGFPRLSMDSSPCSSSLPCSAASATRWAYSTPCRRPS